MLIEDILKTLLVYGPLGVFCALSLAGYIQKDKAMSALIKDHTEATRQSQKDFLEKQEALMKSHKEEMAQMQDRYVTKAETWMDKYRERSEALQNLVEALTQQRKGGG